MGERPSQRDDAAPVVPHRYHRSSDAESRREVAQVGHSLRQRPGEVSRSDHPMPSWSGATTRQPGGAEASNRRHR